MGGDVSSPAGAAAPANCTLAPSEISRTDPTVWGLTSGGAIPPPVTRGPTERPLPTSTSAAGYSGTPLPKKIGISTGHTVALLRPPSGFEHVLGTLPADVVVRHRNQGRRDVAVWFTRSRRELERGMTRMVLAGGDQRL
jgi:hypothetical protein